MFFLKKLDSYFNNYNARFSVNYLRSMMSKYINNVLLISMAITLLAWQGTARAQETNIDELLPIILFVLDNDEIQCPSIPEVPVFTISDDMGVISVENTGEFNPFDPTDLGEFLAGATPIGEGTTAADIADALLADSSVTQLQGDVVISTQEDINELEGVVLITGSLSVNSASLFQELDFSPLSSLVQISGSLSLNTSNTNIEGFQCLATVRNINIVSNESLINIGGFQSLESIDGSLSVFSNNSLESISGFQSLGTIGSNLGLVSNPNLENLGSLARLNRADVVGDILISSNTNFDCSDPEPNFVTATSSSGNAVNCAQDLLFSSLAVANNEAVTIPDSGSVTSTIQIPAQSNASGFVGSLQVNLDITHTSVGDLTVTLSNGSTSINLLAEPSTPADQGILSSAIATLCIDEPFDSGGSFLEEERFGSINEEFLDFNSINAACALAITSALNAGATTEASQEILLAVITSQCVDSFEGDFDVVLISDQGLLENFSSVDSACALEIISAFNGEVCSSNDIVVSLIDNALLPSINSSCSSDDLSTAFSLPVYSPLEPLSTFEGSDINETWTLTITDSVSGETGTLNGWGIVFDIDR